MRRVHWIFQNPPRKTQSHQNSDFLGEHQKTINPAFLWRDLFMSLRGVALQQRENPAEANLILISCPFREIATSLRSSQWHSASHGMKKTLLLAMTIFYPQRAVGTHRAEGISLLPKAKTSYHRFFKVPFREIATLRSQWHKYFVRNKTHSLKSQNFKTNFR